LHRPHDRRPGPLGAAPSQSGTGKAPTKARQPSVAGHLVLRLVVTALLVWLAHEAGWADDCSTPEEAMDTIWVGPPFKGLAAVIIAAAVNGQTSMTQILKPPAADGAKSEGPAAELRLEVTTQDMLTSLSVGDSQGRGVQAWIRAVNAPPALVGAATASIAFQTTSPCLQVSPTQQVGRRKSVRVRAVAGADGSVPEEAVLTVRAVLAGQPVVAPVNFQLEGGYRLVVKATSEWPT